MMLNIHTLTQPPIVMFLFTKSHGKLC